MKRSDIKRKSPIRAARGTAAPGMLNRGPTKKRRDSGTRSAPDWPLEKRLDLHTNKQGKNGCWLWTASITPKGYGELMRRGVGGTRLAHRLAWTIKNGPISDGLQVCHRCDIRACVNPDHLFLGTQKDNIGDMIRKGRRFTGDPKKFGHKGSSHHAAKLTDAQVKAIREDQRSSKQIAKDFDVNDRTIRKIQNGNGWKHIPKNLGLSAVSKGPARDEKHLAKVRAFGCVVLAVSVRAQNCGGYVEAHHVRCLGPRTMGKRKSDYLTIPLCFAHHQGYRLDSAHGDWGEAKFWEWHKINPAAWIASFSPEGRAALEALQPRREG